MLKIDRGVNALFLRQGLIVDLLDKVNHIRMGMEFPDRGFHTLLETQFETQDDYVVTWAWVTGGRGNGIKYTVAVATGNDDVKAGWVQGHKDYVFVRPVSPKFVNAIRHLTLEQLYLIGQISRFDGGGRHKDGWYSKGLFAMELPVPDCLAINVECADPELVVQPECWRIKEGVYVVFPDDTYRLMAFQDYLVTRYWDRPALRQGDLMFFKLQWPIEFDDNGEPVHQHGYTFEMYPEGYSMDRHGVDGLVLVRKSKAEGVYEKDIFLVGPAMVKHPEHGELQIPEGQYEVVMLPGTSRPFQDGID